MKSEKGITLTILIVYVMVFSIVMIVLANMSAYIYNNLKYVNDKSVDVSEFNKFNANFVEDIKTNKDAEVKNLANGLQITFEDGDIYQYIAEEKSIYKNKQKISKDIKAFTAERLIENTNNKKYLRITVEIGTDETKYNRTIDYVLKYW